MRPKYAKLLATAANKCLKDKQFEAIRLCPEFYFEKGRQALQALAQIPIDAYDQIEFLELYAAYKGNYADFVEELKNKPGLLYTLGLALGKCIAYLEKSAANKHEWNEYSDKRSIAGAKLKQSIWLDSLLQYLQNERDAYKVSNEKVRQAILYLSNPSQHFPILSPLHQRQICEHILEKNYDKDQWESDLLAFFEEFQLQIHQPENKTYWISSFLHTPEISRVWRFDEEAVLLNEEQMSMDFYKIASEPEMSYRRVFDGFALNQIFYGVPGTGKTYHSRLHAIAIAEQQSVEWVEMQSAQWLQERWAHHSQAQGQIALLSFHQDMSYQDFIEGIKPKTLKGNIVYELEDGLLKSMAARAARQPDDNFVLVMDEINRGNISAIFGELITLLDADKRDFAANALQVLLPYSKQPFSLPPNLYFIGTMNTADRSIERLDAALRRRFHFRSFVPRPELLTQNIEGIELSALLSKINERIEYLLDSEHCLGHAYLMPVKTLADLQQVFEYQILPLLLDFFAQDLGKVGCVLGEGFVQRQSALSFPLANFEYDGRLDNRDKNRYALQVFPRPLAAFYLE